jgi:hypothetical protein
MLTPDTFKQNDILDDCNCSINVSSLCNEICNPLPPKTEVSATAVLSASLQLNIQYLATVRTAGLQGLAKEFLPSLMAVTTRTFVDSIKLLQ